MKKALLFFCSFALFLSSYSQQFKMPINKVFEYKSETRIANVNDEFELNNYSFHALDKKEGNDNLFECKITGINLKEGNPLKTLVNTDSVRNTNFHTSKSLLALALLNKPFIVQVSPKGKVIAIKNAKETLAREFAKWNIRKDISDVAIKQINTSMLIDIQNLFFNFPNIPLKQGTAWTDKDYRFTVYKTQKNLFYISGINLKNKDAKLEYVIEAPSGLIRNYSYSLNQNVKNLNNQPVQKIIQSAKISNILTNKAVDTAWINMAVNLSFYSSTFKKNESQYDSVKVFDAFKIYDPFYNNDKYYVIRKLEIIQQFRSDNSYRIYDSLLAKTPNQYIKNEPTHLYNKLQTVTEDGTAFEAYDLCKLLYGDNQKLFNNWIQQSFAQHFIRDTVQKINYDLLALLKKDKELYIKEIAPLDLWATALRDPNNIPFLLQSANVLSKMDVTQANSGRYSLLFYKMLVKKDKKIEADSLLSKTTEKLYQASTDTLNATRYAQQNLLAYAYYLKYQTEAKEDSVKALSYLALASKFSPKNSKEKTHDSFYDRVFLKSKESYRQEYLNKILASKDDELFLSLVKEDVNTNPNNLPAMQKLFNKRFKDKSFKDFIVNEVINSWQTAPAFSLKNGDKEPYKSESFKNNWLVLDFWGTWCGPCREEMPKVNKFYEDVKAGKFGNLNFLSIACNDSETAVESYISGNKYSIPVAMSDGIIQRNYKITGYPSKILISPNGKMLNVEFGKDWQGILKSFQAISE